MDIDVFVAQVLGGISNGIIASSGQPGITINPCPVYNPNDNTAAGNMIAVNSFRPIMLVKFDIEVVAHGSVEGASEGKVSVLTFAGAKGQLSGTMEHRRAHRVTFEIPIVFNPK